MNERWLQRPGCPGILKFVACLLLLVADGHARLGIEYQTPLGNPDGAVTDEASRTKFLIRRDQFAISYNDDTHQANWVSWSYSLSDNGSASRTDAWAVEELLPSTFLKIGTSTFGSGWDRGHMCPSADRLKSRADNEFTFRMSNIIPHASQNNQGLWANFESYCRSMASDGDEVLVISGPAHFTGSRIGNQMSIPSSVWKIAVEIPNANSPTPANQRITAAARVIAILTPNVSTGLGTWQSYITSVEEIEEATGLNFFTDIDPSVAIYLKNIVDTGSGPNTPTVVTTFNPTLGPPGTPVVISGYNFGSSPAVSFNGTPAAVTAVGGNVLTAIVPAGAASGPITVTGPGGTDASYEDFTVTSGSMPILSLSATALTDLSATRGSPGTAKLYAVTGGRLTSPAILTATEGIEISPDGVNYGQTLTLAPAIDGSVTAQISVRLKTSETLGAVSGTITHTSPGATTRTLDVSGTVLTSSPYIDLSTAALPGFTATGGFSGAVKSYTVSGRNLSGNITVAAPSGFEVGLSDNSFGPVCTLVPSSGSLTAVPVYVRVVSGTPVGAVSGTIIHSGGGVPAQDLAVSGNVLAAGVSETATFVWDFAQATPTSGSLATASVGAVTQGNNNGTTAMLTSQSVSGGYTGASGGQNAGAAARTGALNTAAGGSAYFEFTVTPDPGYTFTVSDISFGTRSTSTGPQAYGIRSSADNFASNLAAGAIANNSSWTLKSHTLETAHSGAVTFRIYGHSGSGNATAGTANWRIDDLRLTVASGASIPPAPAITSAATAGATANQSFSYQITASHSPTSFGASGLPAWLSVDGSTGVISGTPPAPGTFTFFVSATNEIGENAALVTLTVAPDPDAPVITGPLGATGQIGAAFSYKITASNTPTSHLASGLPPGLSIAPATGLISGTPQAAGSFEVTISASNAAGADSKTLVITIRNPSTSLSAGSLQPFSANLGFASAPQGYSFTGTDLTGPVTVVAPAGFEISNDGSNFSGQLILAPDGSANVSAVISVRLSALAGLGENSGSLIHTGGGATPKYLPLSGTVQATIPTISLSVANLAAFSTKAGTASFVESYTVNAASLTGPVTVTAPAGFELSTDEEIFSSSLVLPVVNGRIAAAEIHVRLAASAPAGNYGGNITHSGGSATAQSLPVTGTVTALSGPPITSPSSGSIYAGGSFSLAITAGGDLPVTGYGAANLPPGLTVSTSTGAVSGTVAAAGSYTFQVSASNADGTTTADYRLRVVSSAEQAALPFSVAVNKYQNATIDRVELLVLGDSTDGAPGPPVDMRGMTLKDFSSSMAGDFGGKFVFNDAPLWSSVKAGTLIVLSAGNTEAEDLDGSDFVLRVNLGNTGLFTFGGGTFDILATDMVMIKAPNTGVSGIAGGIHALAMGTAGTQYSAFTGKRLRSTSALTTGRPFGYALNSGAVATDFYGSGQATNAATLTFGSGNTTGNTSFITSLRNLDQTPPVLTLNGSAQVNLIVGAPYVEQGATAVDAKDGVRPVVISGTVTTSVPGTCTVTYSASDTAGNTATATRTVLVSAPAAPGISATGSQAALHTVYGDASESGSFTLSATNLAAPVTITAPEGFEVALDADDAFSATLPVGSTGTLPETTVFVRLAAGAPAGVYAGDITLETPGAVTATVPLAPSLVELRPAAITGLAGVGKIYDGSAVATVTGTPVVAGILPADTGSVNLGGSPSFTFNDPNAQTGKPITATGFTLTGSAAVNYVLSQPAGLSADIIPAALADGQVDFTPAPGGGFTANAAGVAGFEFIYSGRDITGFDESSTPPGAPGFYTVTATSTDPNVTGSANHDFFIAGLLLADDEIARTDGAETVAIAADEILANDRWIDDTGTLRTDGLTVTAVTGGGVTLDGSTIRFTPGAAEDGSFRYTAVAAAYSGQAGVSVSVTRPLVLRIGSIGTPVRDSGHDVTTVTHRLGVTPGATCEIEYTTSLSGPWSSAGEFTGDSGGNLDVTITAPGDRREEFRRGMFFRIRR